MTKLFRTLAVLASCALASTLFADLSNSIGTVGSGQTLEIAFETYSDGSLEIIDENTNQVVASVQILYNGWWFPYTPFYGSYGHSSVSGVNVEVSYGGVATITGLPEGNYRLQTHTYVASYNQYTSGNYTYEEIPESWGYNYLSTYTNIY